MAENYKNPKPAEVLYEIGPITGIESENRQEFERVRIELVKQGYTAFTPFRVMEFAKRSNPIAEQYADLWETCMEFSLKCILSCWDYAYEPPIFGIAMLDGWEHSKGARIEHDLATALGIPCKPWKEWINDRL